jgi:hypothetical protein
MYHRQEGLNPELGAPHLSLNLNQGGHSAAFPIGVNMPKHAAKPRPFVVPRLPKLKRPDSAKPSVESTGPEWIQTHFDLNALLDDEGAENA